MGDGAEELAIRELDFEASYAGRGLALAGNADSSVAAPLQNLVARVHETRGGQEIVIDLRGLEFMAASCFNVLVGWVGMINELPIEQRYQLRFTINAGVPWQRRSLATLSCFATDIVKVEDR